MPSPGHTYQSKCRLAPVPELPRAQNEELYPPIVAQFFYQSAIPIDDPLAPGTIAGVSETKSAKGRLRPFSAGDNNSLEKSWLSLASEIHRARHRDAKKQHNLGSTATRDTTQKRARLVKYIAERHLRKHGDDFQPRDAPLPPGMEVPADVNALPACCPEMLQDVDESLRDGFCALVRKEDETLLQGSIAQEVMMDMHYSRLAGQSYEHGYQNSISVPSAKVKSETTTTTFAQVDINNETGEAHVTRSHQFSSLSHTAGRASWPAVIPGIQFPIRPPVGDDGLSGKPFVRVGTPETPVVALPSPSPPRDSSSHMSRNVDESAAEESQSKTCQSIADPVGRSRAREETRSVHVFDDSLENSPPILGITVGVSRLHTVSLPRLLMKPIYWSPVNDVAIVMRATWFYRDSMLPVDPIAANQLEAGYRELRPFTETWQDELRCAVEVGPLGEEKVSHQLWPSEKVGSYNDEYGLTNPEVSTDHFCAAHCFRGEVAIEGSMAPNHTSKSREATMASPRNYANYHVIYKDRKLAFLLKPSLKPSAYYGRRPVAKIMRGADLGIPVVRGFDRAVWESLHEPVSRAEVQAPASAASASLDSIGQGVCPACKAERERGQVTDLVLVAHGIGQKFAERVESFHFTHAVNALRRAVNVELKTDDVKRVLHPRQNGIMVLPVNWRHTLSFEDGDPKGGEHGAVAAGAPSFTLKDVEPVTIPAVRSLISDIMFDVPFYMSHHKSRMIEGLVAEANRVYRLWCQNNPEFHANGRVHLLGHSLGSAMAVEILSKQPTIVPQLDLSITSPQTNFLEFDTKNLFLVGSPAAFFLLLERGALLPRRGRLKPGAEPADTMANGVVGETGQFGCLAVDNIYNILAKEDPIAYLLNGTIDPEYSASLKPAYVPSTAASIFKSMGDAMLGVLPTIGTTSSTMGPSVAKPPTVRLPSQLELEIHDFTREELAEKKAYLLNDNGQIDYFLHSGSGPFEIQYLNMLSAHSSYWTNQDFIRMLCMEIGRSPGRANTIPALRAVKRTQRMLPGPR